MTTQTDRKSLPGHIAHDIAAKFQERKRRILTLSAVARNATIAPTTTYYDVQRMIAKRKQRRIRTN